VINFISIFTGIVFSLAEDGTLQRGPLGYLPYIVAGLYGVSLIYSLYKNSNKLYTEIVPIVYLALAFASGVFLPFLFGRNYATIFCTTIIIALFIYYVFSIHQLSKKDPLIGTLNLQAFYDDSTVNPNEITALISIDMNGLKEINDTFGHAAGDEALITLTECFKRVLNQKQSIYRIGGDEFVIICRNLSQDAVSDLISRIQSETAKTKYSCAVGYCFKGNRNISISEMLKESDVNMYAEKAKYYSDIRKDRRRR
jgi:diguanylate cyclase (GGDEF)-like protein